MLEQTVEQQERQLRWYRRRQRVMTPRRLLQESDDLLFWVEECLVQGARIVPGWLISRLMVVLRQTGSHMPSRLGRERRPAQVMDIIYDAQAELMDQSCRGRGPAEIIPLLARAQERALEEAATS